MSNQKSLTSKWIYLCCCLNSYPTTFTSFSFLSFLHWRKARWPASDIYGCCVNRNTIAISVLNWVAGIVHSVCVLSLFRFPARKCARDRKQGDWRSRQACSRSFREMHDTIGVKRRDSLDLCCSKLSEQSWFKHLYITFSNMSLVTRAKTSSRIA